MILFLDIDGVLRRLDSEPWKLDYDCLASFEDVVRRFPELRIVISSSWRLDYSLNALKELFSTDVALSVVGVTPEAQRITKHYRYHEVTTYLKQTQQSQVPWLAVDDDPEHFPKNCAVIITDSFVGFDWNAGENLRRVIQGYGGWEISHCAVIPFVRDGNDIRVVLITSKHQEKWIFAKGVIESDIPIYGTAAIEAFEEAGCLGRIYPVPIGRYTDQTDRGNRGVLVYLMEVLELLDAWEEDSLRSRRIVSTREAQSLLNDNGRNRMLTRMVEMIENTDGLRWLEYDVTKHISQGEIQLARRK